MSWSYMGQWCSGGLFMREWWMVEWFVGECWVGLWMGTKWVANMLFSLYSSPTECGLIWDVSTLMPPKETSSSAFVTTPEKVLPRSCLSCCLFVCYLDVCFFLCLLCYVAFFFVILFIFHFFHVGLVDYFFFFSLFNWFIHFFSIIFIYLFIHLFFILIVFIVNYKSFISHTSFSSAFIHREEGAQKDWEQNISFGECLVWNSARNTDIGYFLE